MRSKIYFRQLFLTVILLVPVIVSAQTTEFTYEGFLNYSGQPANGNFDFEFKLYDAASGGAQQGATLQRLNVTVTNGVFTVTLDFGAAVFPGDNRFLETGARPAGTSDPFTVTSPRPQITSAPYSIRSLNAGNASQLGSVDANQYVLTTDPRMTDARNPLPNSASYIQNISLQQAASNFNISGNGTVGGILSGNIVNATTQFNFGGNRILSNAGMSNLFVGIDAGRINTGNENTFVGHGAGYSNDSTWGNTFFGSLAGYSNTGSGNSFFGRRAGRLNTTGYRNSFFGDGVGSNNTTGSFNSFFGNGAGSFNTTGESNSFFGEDAGDSNQTGNNNSFFGREAGELNNTGSNNSFFGYRAGKVNTTGLNSFFGSNAGLANTTGGSNSFFGYSVGATNTTGSRNAFFGNNSGLDNTTGGMNSFFGYRAGDSNTTGSNNTIIGNNADVGSGNLSYATAIGAGAVVSTNNSVVLGRSDGSDTVRVPGYLIVYNLAVGGSTHLCGNGGGIGYISTCSSSLRYKTDVLPFTGGLDVVRRLRPITFNWKADGLPDVGFAAEDVEKIEPRLITYNSTGDIEGVKYGQVTTVLVNSVNEQQTQIEQLQRRIEEQQKQIEALKKLICPPNPNAEICKEQ